MKLEFQPLVLSQVTQSLSLEGSGLVHCFSGSAFIGPEEEITQREGAPDPLMPCSVVWRGNLRSVGMCVMTGEDAGLACDGTGRKHWWGCFRCLCVDGVGSKSSELTE